MVPVDLLFFGRIIRIFDKTSWSFRRSLESELRLRDYRLDHCLGVEYQEMLGVNTADAHKPSRFSNVCMSVVRWGWDVWITVHQFQQDIDIFGWIICSGNQTSRLLHGRTSRLRITTFVLTHFRTGQRSYDGAALFYVQSHLVHGKRF